MNLARIVHFYSLGGRLNYPPRHGVIAVKDYIHHHRLIIQISWDKKVEMIRSGQGETQDTDWLTPI